MLNYLNSKTRNIIITTFLIALIMFMGGCEEKMEANFTPIGTDMKIIKDEAIRSLLVKKILFGHASVGNNIISGIEDIAKSDERFNKIQFYKLEDAIQPGFYDFKVRRNGYPKEKCDYFIKVLTNQDLGNMFNIAFFKFCFVDIDQESNVHDIFNHYVETINYIKIKFPKLTFLHVTIPLKVHSWELRDLLFNLSKGKLANVRRIISSFKRNLTGGDIANVKRNEFNILLINKFGGIDPIYDLAKVESTLPNGKRVKFKHEGDEYYSLAKQYSDDGGHLNEFGRYYAAKELLITLSHITN